MDFVKRKFSEYVLSWVPAVRVFEAGRVKGGMIVGYRNNCDITKSCTMVDIEGYKVILMENGTKSVYYIPVYLSGGSDWEGDWMNLWQLLEMLEGKNLVIMGDFNSRIADFQELSDDNIGGEIAVPRCSKNGVLNSKGRKFLELCEQ